MKLFICVIVFALNFTNNQSGILSNPQSVGQTKKDSPSTMNNFLHMVSGGNYEVNKKMTEALDEFLTNVVPAQCRHLFEVKEKFLNNLKLTSNDNIDQTIMKALDNLTSSIMPNLCHQNSTKNFVKTSVNANNLFDHLNKLSDWIKDAAFSKEKKEKN